MRPDSIAKSENRREQAARDEVAVKIKPPALRSHAAQKPPEI